MGNKQIKTCLYHHDVIKNYPANISLFKVNNKSTRKRFEIRTTFEHILHFFLLFPLLTLNKQLSWIFFRTKLKYERLFPQISISLRHLFVIELLPFKKFYVLKNYHPRKFRREMLEIILILRSMVFLELGNVNCVVENKLLVPPPPQKKKCQKTEIWSRDSQRYRELPKKISCP